MQNGVRQMQFSLHEADWKQPWGLAVVETRRFFLESILQYPLRIFSYKHMVRIHKYILSLIFSKYVTIWRDSQRLITSGTFSFWGERRVRLKIQCECESKKRAKKVLDAILGQRGCSSDPVREERKLSISTWKPRVAVRRQTWREAKHGAHLSAGST